MNKTSSTTFWQTMFAFTFIVNLVILVASISRWVELKVVMWRSIWIIPLFLYLAVLLVCVTWFIRSRQGKTPKIFSLLDGTLFPGQNTSWNPWLRSLAGAIFIGIAWLIPYLKFTYHIGEIVKKSTQDPVLTTIVFYWAVWWLILAASGALKLAFKTSWAGGFASAQILLGIAYELFMRAQAVTNYPFSLGWSESSRYYYGSLLFAKSIYGMSLPLSTLHPSRYILQSLPFLFSGLGLAASRFWQVALWIIMSAITAVCLVRRFPSSGRTLENPAQAWWKKPLNLLLAGWLLLYLLRVGVYYHLEVMVFVPLLLVSSKHPWRTLAAVLFASAWAGISRVNWFPVPAMIAIALYLLEEPVSGKNSGILSYLKWPLILGVSGLVTALAAQAAYIPLSGNAANAKAFTSSFTSPELWYRLWPNDSYPLGIIPAILVVIGPMILIMALVTIKQFRAIHPLRWFGLWGMLLVLLAGGLAVSVKIGGGGDLHNMDAFAVLIAIIALGFINGWAQAETQTPAAGFLPWPVAAVALLIPLILLIPQLSPPQIFHQQANQRVLVQLKKMAEKAGQNGEVLFINERHLITFHQVNVPLVPDYEAVTLMEMAMSDNQPYLQKFYSDLKNHRFAAIVTGKQNVGIKEEGSFAEENNTWNTKVSPYILCYYEPVTVTASSETVTYLEADESRIEFYIPRTVPVTCPQG